MSSLFTYTTPDKCEARKEDDFYPTPWQATEALMIAEEPWLRHIDEIDEPACGDGAMAKVISRHGKTVQATDLIYRGFGTGGSDFLNAHRERWGRGLITNPPFVHAEDFIRQAHRIGYEYIAMILKANYWHAQTRIPLFIEHTPVRIRPYGWRVDFTGGGSNHFDCLAVIWMPEVQAENQRAHGKKMAEYCAPLERPTYQPQPTLF